MNAQATLDILNKVKDKEDPIVALNDLYEDKYDDNFGPLYEIVRKIYQSGIKKGYNIGKKAIVNEMIERYEDI